MHHLSGIFIHSGGVHHLSGIFIHMGGGTPRHCNIYPEGGYTTSVEHLSTGEGGGTTSVENLFTGGVHHLSGTFIHKGGGGT